MNVAVVAGEASGDRQAANLVKQLGDLIEPGDAINAWGIGGAELRSVDCDIIADSSRWGTIGVVESAKQLFPLLFAMWKFKREFLLRRPDVLILVDFGAFNIPLAQWVKKKTRFVSRDEPTDSSVRVRSACPICYYFPPSSWRRKMSPKSLSRLADVSDIIFTPFPWSAQMLASVGGNAHFLGHPLLDTVRPTRTQSQFDKVYGLDSDKAVITLLPGSREHEVRHILPVLLGAAGEIARRLPGVQFLVARADNLPRKLIEDILATVQREEESASLLHLVQQAGDLLKQASSALKPAVSERIPILATPEGLVVAPDEEELISKPWVEHQRKSHPQSASLLIVEHDTLNALSRSDLVIAASGTATLEAALLNKPEIIVYRGSELMNFEYRVRRKALNITYIGLPNILADSMVCPEFVQDDATVRNIAEEALDLLLQPDRSFQMRTALQSVVKKNLGETGATRRCASELLRFLSQDQMSVDTESIRNGQVN